MSQRPIPSKINNYNVYNDNQGGRLIGVGAETTLPPFESMAETVSGAGILGEFDDPAVGHFSNMQLEIPFRLLDGESIDLMDPNGVALTLRVSQQVMDDQMVTDFRSMRVVVRGKCATLDPGTLNPANPMNASVAVNIAYIKIEVDDEELVELNKFNPRFAIRGVDKLQKVRDQT